MSAEVVKKRGRPKKIIADLSEVESPTAPKQAAIRSKSTKSNPLPSISKTKSSKAPPAAKPMARPEPSPPPAQKSSAKPVAPASSKPVYPSPPTAEKPTAHSPVTPVTPETSKILSQVRDRLGKNAGSDSSSASKPTSTSAISSKPATPKTVRPPPPPKTHAPPSPTSGKPPSSPPPKAPTPPSNPTSKVPIASLNSQIVNNIATRAGARPNASTRQKPLPSNYKSVARKVTMAIVAMPIAIVTSWVLYQRLVLGEERKLLVIPGLTKVEEPGNSNGGSGSEPSAST